MEKDISLLSISTKDDVEKRKMVLLLAIGISMALQKEVITLDEAEKFLFTPYTAVSLEKKGFSSEIVKIIDLGCELENVLSIIPYHWDSSINEILELSLEELKKLPTAKPGSKKWLDKDQTC